MNTMATPRDLSFRMILKSDSVSFPDREEVGSSIIMILALMLTALMISTICFWAMVRDLTRDFALIFSSYSSKRAWACWNISFHWTMPCFIGYLPINTFSATVIRSIRLSS